MQNEHGDMTMILRSAFPKRLLDEPLASQQLDHGIGTLVDATALPHRTPDLASGVLRTWRSRRGSCEARLRRPWRTGPWCRVVGKPRWGSPRARPGTGPGRSTWRPFCRTSSEGATNEATQIRPASLSVCGQVGAAAQVLAAILGGVAQIPAESSAKRFRRRSSQPRGPGRRACVPPRDRSPFCRCRSIRSTARSPAFWPKRAARSSAETAETSACFAARPASSSSQIERCRTIARFVQNHSGGHGGVGDSVDRR